MTARTHVMHVVPTLAHGGMELAMARVICGLQPRGLRHTVVCLKGDPLIAGRLEGMAAIHCLHADRGESGVIRALRGLVRRVRPTVIHARNWSAWPEVAVARLLAGAVDVPLIFSFHGVDRAGRMPLRRRVVSRLLIPATSLIFTVSQATQAYLAREIGVPRRRIAVIPNGVDTDRFQPGDRRGQARTAQGLVIGTVGNLTGVKNQALLLRACAQLEVPWQLRLAGEGPERENLLALAETLGVSRRVHLAGSVEDVPEFLRGLDVFVLSSHSEAHPNALIEAMACGLPCVGTDVGGVPEVLGGGRFGLVARAGDAAEMAACLRRLAQDPSMRRQLSLAARERVVEAYGLEAMLSEYERLYRSRPEDLARWPLAARADRTAGREERSRPSVLMLGPLSPLTGGMVAVAENLLRSRLANTCRLTAMNTGKTTPPGRSLAAGVAAQCSLLAKAFSRTVRGGVRILHIHTCSGLSFWRDGLLVLMARLLGRRVVLHIHGGQFDAFLGSLPWPGRGMAGWILRQAGAAIVLSPAWEERLRPFSPRAKWMVVPNGVPLPPSVPDRSDTPSRLLFLGNLSSQKGVADLVEAARLAAANGWRGDMVLAGGETQAGQSEELARRIEAAGMSAQVRLAGVLQGEQKDSSLRDASIFVLPSYAEGLPMAMLEAMAWGLPVIVTSVGAIPEVVRDGQEGFLVQPGDVGAMAERIERLAADQRLRQRMGQAARSRIAEEFSLDAVATKLLRTYRRVLDPRNTAA